MRRVLVVVVTLAAAFLSVVQLSDNKPAMAATEVALVECLGYNKPGCQESWISAKMSQDGPRETVAAVGGSLSPVVVASCHTLMHEIGIKAHDTYRDRGIKSILLEADSDCQFGYQHGVFIAASGDIADDVSFIDTVYQACSAYEGNEYNRTSCRHGIGHAATIRTNGDVLKASNDLCSKMTTDAAHCVTGAVMEWVSSYAREAAAREPALVEVCGEIAEGLQQSCWREIPGLWRMIGESGPASLVRCSKLSQENKEYCSRGVGFRSTADTDCQGPDAATTGVCMGGRAIMYYEMQYKTDQDASNKVCPTLKEDVARELCVRELQYTIDAYASIGG